MINYLKIMKLIQAICKIEGSGKGNNNIPKKNLFSYFESQND